ncbi:MAG: 50S ribosomal protein L4 [Pontiellaceae bacterium]|nr:50S ribosomal protein L4 [Pontiellaceae bacterium]
MSTLPLKDCRGNKLGEVTLSEKFTVADRGAQAAHQAVIAHQAHQHQGSASTLRKGEVAGSNKKPWKQKGLGRARSGYRQSPVWRGGGVAFGPHPHKVRKQVPKKVARLAFARVFGERAEAGQIMVLDDLTLAAPRTKEMCSLLKALEIKGKILLILDAPDSNVCLAARNLQDVEVVCAANVNTYQIVRYPQIVITKAGVEKLEQRLA